MTAPHSSPLSFIGSRQRDACQAEAVHRSKRLCEIIEHHCVAGFPFALGFPTSERTFIADDNCGRSSGILLSDRRFVFAILPQSSPDSSSLDWMSATFTSLHAWLAYPADSIGRPSTAHHSHIHWQPVGPFFQLNRQSLESYIEQIDGLAEALRKRHGKWIRNRLASPIRYLPNMLIPSEVPAALHT